VREIKFRAWDKREKEMLHVYSMGFTHSGVSDFRLDDDEYFFRAENTDDYELMQYTGLKDKNEKDIYEGDIVDAPGHWGVGVVEYGQGIAAAFTFNNQPLGLIDYSDIEVIGNIYENPKLLKQKARSL
jgi:uncharacterized phage protein (TIGR01671 family)